MLSVQVLNKYSLGRNAALYITLEECLVLKPAFFISTYSGSIAAGLI